MNVKQTRLADQYTIENLPIASIDLMEQASLAFVKAIETKLEQGNKIGVLCGVGNNGGDGMAVARILQEKGFEVDTFLIKFKANLSADCAINMSRLRNVKVIENESYLPSLAHYDVLIDAILGSGLSQSPRDFLAAVIAHINASGKKIYAIDVPSGLAADDLLNNPTAVKTDVCISFQRPKLAFFYPENYTYLKHWSSVDIGLDEAFIQAQDTKYFLLDESIAAHVKIREKHSHKGSYGHALMIAGSYGKVGAAILANKSCLRSGVGLLTSYVPKCAYEIKKIAVPERMCQTYPNEKFISMAPEVENYDAVGIGPGLGTSIDTDRVLLSILKNTKRALVIDADAINLLAKDEQLLKYLPKNSILTPHPKEFERLVGTASNSKERLQQQIDFAKKHQCIVVLKGANTSITDPEGHVFFNNSGNPGMATGGSGDVLTGIITALLAQAYEPLLAALIAVYFHGKAGDDARLVKGENALIASDIIDYLMIENK